MCNNIKIVPADQRFDFYQIVPTVNTCKTGKQIYRFYMKIKKNKSNDIFFLSEEGVHTVFVRNAQKLP